MGVCQRQRSYHRLSDPGQWDAGLGSRCTGRLGGGRDPGVGGYFASEDDGRVLAVGESITAANDLGTLGGNDSAAFDINEMGWVVGMAKTAAQENRGFLHDGMRMWDLNDLLAESGWLIYSADGINDAGQILALAQ